MDLFSVLGWVLSAVLIVFGMVLTSVVGPDGAEHYELLWQNMGNFVDMPSVVIVMGGVVAALMISFPGKSFAKVPKHLKIVLFPTKYDPMSYITQLVEFAKEARINGLLALEDKLTNVEDQFLKNSLMLVVDSVEPEKVKGLLETELDYLDDRHSQDRNFYDKGSAFAPAFGMIGTLIGLINLLGQLDDPSAIGPAMAVALITTFYGTFLSNVVFSPISNKLKERHEEEYLCKMIICEGVQAIQSGDNPKFIEEKLTQLLPSSMVGTAGAGGEEGGDKPRRGRKKK